MSGLEVRRQYYRSCIRKSQIQKEFRNKRMLLLYHMDSSPTQEELTIQYLDKIYDDLERQEYSTGSLLEFIRSVMTKHTRSLNIPELFCRLRYVMQYIEQRQESTVAKKMVKDLLTRVVSYGVDNPLYLDPFFTELLKLIMNPQFELSSIWPILSLVRNSALTPSIVFNAFTDFIKLYPTDVDDLITCILETFMNLTHIDPDFCQKTLKIDQYIEASQMIAKLMEHYEFGNRDMQRAINTLRNIILSFDNYDDAYEIIDAGNIIRLLMETLLARVQKGSPVQLQCARQIITMVAAICGAEKKSLMVKIVQQNPEIIKQLCSLLPLDISFSSVPIPRPVKWGHLNTELTIGVLLALANLAAFDDLVFTLAGQALPYLIELSAYDNSRVQQQVSIFLWNLCRSRNNLMCQILCERDVFFAVNYILTANHSSQAVSWCLKVIQSILISAEAESQNVGSFSKKAIVATLEREGIIKKIEQFVVHEKEKISKAAIGCLELFD